MMRCAYIAECILLSVPRCLATAHPLGGNATALAASPRVRLSMRVHDAPPECAERWRAARWRGGGQSGTAASRAVEPRRAVLWLDYRDGLLCLVGNANGQRAELSSLMLELALTEAFREARPVPAFRLVFDLNDHSCHGDLVYARCPGCRRKRGPCSPLLVPDYTFFSWRYSGIDSYSLAARDFAQLGTQPSRKHVCGWAGALTSHRSRERFARLADANSMVLEAYRRCTPRRGGEGLCSAKAISQREQISRWACLVDLPAIGYSGRLPLLLHSGRPLLFVQRRMEIWYRDARSRGALSAWEHYALVMALLGDMFARARWVLNGGGSNVTVMARRGRAFARRVLSLRTAVRYLMLQLLRAANAPGLPPHERMIEVAAAGGEERAAALKRGITPVVDAIAEAEAATFDQMVSRWPHLFVLGADTDLICNPGRSVCKVVKLKIPKTLGAPLKPVATAPKEGTNLNADFPDRRQRGPELLSSNGT